MAKTTKKSVKSPKKPAAKKAAASKPSKTKTSKAPAKKKSTKAVAKKPVKKSTTATKKKAITVSKAKKAPVKKVATKKETAKKPVKKTVAKKAPAKKVTAKKTVKKTPAKKVAKKAAPKKTAAKKAPIKKAAAKSSAKATKKKTTSSVKKKTISTKTPKKTTKAAAKAPQAKATTASAKKPASTKAKKVSAPKNASKKASVNKEEHIKKAIKKLAGANKNTPAAFKVPSRKNTPIVFSMDDMQSVLKDSSKKKDEVLSPVAVKKTKVENLEVEHKPRSVASATLDDLLGLGGGSKPAKQRNKEDVPRKWISYYNALMDMRDRLTLSVEERSEETKASAKDSAGDLSSYGQHIGDAGTAAYDYDFALSMVSSEQDLLKEVDAALDRIFDGTYGICEVTEKPIKRERLQAVPFTRFSKEGQDQFEKTRRRREQRIGIASDDDDNSFASFGDEVDE